MIYNAENSDFLNIPGVFTDVASSSGIRFCLAELDPFLEHAPSVQIMISFSLIEAGGFSKIKQH